ncbi:hypothetical protein PQE74_gp145 [Bacillus phage vB_BanS_Chewbecca]|uniref:DUF6915 domain-containing protein n=1 Tax=Bacillus phage vB_BanS_Chewbecca TaxID=2894786 RepID=A0AAE8YRC2_9CAUD|nr:hypothetical protein PQE74_gp145 [Bacillus phage vB_BanS_Chewbecca]UGO46228.1 hypothetical protein CHEWBECCA_145 [Bacillus phage vB_BanS_Chewbecca]
MSHPHIHAKSSVKFFGGKEEDYIAIHNWFDDSKAYLGDMRHRALKHHTAGIYEAERVFGESFVNSDGKKVYTRYVGEQHVIEDMGFLPSLADWLENMELQNWMMNRDKRVKEFGRELPRTLRQKIKETEQQNMEKGD